MADRPLTPLGLAMRDSLPEVLRGSTDYLAIVHSCAREIERLEAALEQVRAQFNPATADLLLPAWEYQLRLPVGGLPGATLGQRQTNVLARLKKVLSGGAGRDWEAAITNLVGPGWSYREHDPADPSSPAPGVIKLSVPIDPTSVTFANLQQLVADMTDGHIVVEIDSYGPFYLDESEMDVTEFGV